MSMYHVSCMLTFVNTYYFVQKATEIGYLHVQRLIIMSH